METTLSYLSIFITSCKHWALIIIYVRIHIKGKRKDVKKHEHEKKYDYFCHRHDDDFSSML